MKAQANQIRPGWVLQHNGRQYTVLKINIITPGKGGAFIQVDMRDIDTGNKTNERWRTVDTVEKLMAEEKDAQYLYSDGEKLYFMNQENFEQIEIPCEVLGEKIGFLQDNMMVSINFVEERAISINLPTHVILQIKETEPALKGQTVTSSYKPAILENGMKVQVPPFISSGEKIVVATEDCSYVERAK
ncbi:MAG: Elongation factor P [Alphaproteobacteria bacterium ADurb.Bin438]|nr:MAG: Elongation factor P [Alphaproteobacteria bacterium ADurb.Bin438]